MPLDNELIVSIKGVYKNFDKPPIVVLRNISLDIFKGEFFGLIGYSGAGKSSLLRCIAGLTEPSSGEIRRFYSKVGMIFQNFALLSQRSALANVMLPMELQGIDVKVATARAIKCLEEVGLGEQKYAYPFQLSGGQKQRVAIARAIAYNAELLVCDECTSSLDPVAAREILELLLRLNRSQGITVLLVSHSVVAVQKTCDRVGILESGRIVACGITEEVLKQDHGYFAGGL